MIFYLGIFLVSLAFIFTTTAVSAFFLYHKNRNENLFLLGKRAFYIASTGIVFSIVLMIYLLMTHHFEYAYVFSYTNRSLSKFYLFSALWAGQEGTFLLWLFYGSIYGFILLKQKPKNLHIVLGSILLVHFFILLILLAKNPFAMIWHEFQDAPVGFIPQDGRGLNPLLMNPWMVIHPPTLFLGYTSAEVIFGFAMAAFLTRDFKNWFKPAWSWALYGTAILGIGIILGGYWAYATLGWGGFWGWDPVENASFVPWMVYATLIHGLILQKSRNALVKTNMFLAGLVFILVLYGSFLTRSGVLTDFSVHSFGESELNVYLTVFLLFFIFLFGILYIINLKHMKSEPLKSEMFTRETFLVFGMMVLILSGILTFVGMSFPLFSSLFGQPTSVPTSYYNKLHIPIAILIAVLGGLAPLLSWSKSAVQKKNILFVSLGVSLIATIIGLMSGMHDIRSIIMFFAASFFLVTNVGILIEIIRKDMRRIGAFVTHIGIAMMLMGIIFSSFYSKSDKVNLPQGKVVETPLGIKLKFEGRIPEKDGRDRMKITVIEKDNKEWTAKPRFFFSQFNRAYMASPDIDYQLKGDIYLAPIQYIPANQAQSKQFMFSEGTEKRYGDYLIRFIGFDVNNHAEEGTLKVTANFEIEYTENGYKKTETITPRIEMGSAGMKKIPVQFSDLKFQIGKINANDRNVVLVIQDERNSEMASDILSVQISVKPLISLMWLGTVLLGIGMLISLLYRLKFREV